MSTARVGGCGIRSAAWLGLLLAVAMSADARGAVLVYQHPDSREIVAAYGTGSHAHVIAHGRNPYLSPDGRRVVFIKRRRNGLDRLYVVSTKGGRPRLVARDVFLLTDPRCQEVWAPDNRHVIVGDASGGALIVDVVRRTQRAVVLDGGFGCGTFAPSRKQLAIVAARRESDIYLFRADGSHERRMATGDWPVWGRPGLAFISGGSVVVKPGPGKRARRLGRLGVPVGWSSDGRTLLGWGGEFPDALRAVLINPATRTTRSLPFTFTAVDGISQDGSFVLGEGGGDVVAAPSDGGNLRVLAHSATAASWTR